MERSADHAVGIHGRAAELARIGRFLDEAAGVSGGLSNPARNTVKLTQPGRPHTVAGPLHPFSSPAHSAFGGHLGA